MKRKEEDRRRKLEEEEQKIVRKQQEQNDLERRLGTILPQVNEANLISKELKRDVKFNVCYPFLFIIDVIGQTG